MKDARALGRMGRKRAAFREGIGEEQRHYAQALRDIRDRRGETQQELGRLLGWSVSMVSRFEAATERPDRGDPSAVLCARSDRGAAPALDGGLRNLAPLNGRPRHAAPSPAVARRVARPRPGGPGVYQLLEADTRRTRWCGCSVTRPSHCRCGPSWHRPSSGWTSRRRSGRSTSRAACLMCGPGATGSRVILEERQEFKRHLEEWDRQLREIQPASGRISTPGTSSPTTSPP